MPIAADCRQDSNTYDCEIQVSDVGVYHTNISIVEDPERGGTRIVQSKYSTQVLQNGTDGSPGSGRDSSIWSFDGFSDIIKVEPDQIENMKNLYTKEVQQKSVRAQCGDDFGWFDPNSTTKQTFFVPGHYAANSDYNSDIFRQSTFHYFNAAPQWQTFNNGNWKNRVESHIQKLVRNTGDKYQIYSGSYGQLVCPNNPSVPIYLQNEVVNEDKIQIAVPIPMVYFKVVAPYYLQSPQLPILIATINHPTMIKRDVEKYLGENFCHHTQDVCLKLLQNPGPEYDWFIPSGFTCEKTNEDMVDTGYTYACEATPAILSRLGIKLYDVVRVLKAIFTLGLSEIINLNN